jgi:transcription factor SFP1
MTHGSCNFAPPKDLEHVKDLLERKRRDREREREKLGGAAEDSGPAGLGRSMSLGNIGDGDDTLDLSNISESELREVEREAEKRMKPFACGVGDCQRRYKNMNGLRYHYQHSGDHGAVGLALLASGQHECLQGQKRNQSNTGSKQGADGDKDIKRPTTTLTNGLVSRASSSMPVSRASSRTGTPQPLPQPGIHYSPTNSSVSVNTVGMTHAQPFTPPQASAQQQLSPLQGHAQAQQLAAAAYHQQYAAQLQRQQQQQYQQYAHIQAVQIHAQQQPQQQQVLHAQVVYSNGADMS